jgi:DHA3 family macrolide efflux protein-like MFS transporter
VGYKVGQAYLEAAVLYRLDGTEFLHSAWGGFKRRSVTALVGLTGVGVGSLAFGLVPGSAFGLAIAIMFIHTAMVPFIRSSVFQSYVPPELQGRVFTLLLSSISLMAPAGLALSGPVADAHGIPVIFIATGIGCLILVVAWLLSPAILNETQMCRGCAEGWRTDKPHGMPFRQLT